MKLWQILLIIAMIVLAAAALAVMFIKSPKQTPSYRMAFLVLLISLAAATGSYSLTVVGHEDTRSEIFANISNAYKQYGFVMWTKKAHKTKGSQTRFYLHLK